MQEPKAIEKLMAVLFIKEDGIKKNQISEVCGVDTSAVDNLIVELKQKLSEIGLMLVINDTNISLYTAPHLSTLIEKYLKKEDEKELSKATLETLAIIAYRGPVSRSEIDHIRGVNSRFILRSLRTRGLITTASDKDGDYILTNQAIAHIGLSSISELPDYEDIQKKVAQFENNDKAKQAE